jgi:hypothetical protein
MIAARGAAALAALAVAFMAVPANAATTDATTRAKPEHISAVSLCIGLEHAARTIDLAAGTTRYADAGRKVTPADMFQSAEDQRHPRQMAAAISRVEERLDPTAAEYDEPDSRLRQRERDRSTTPAVSDEPAFFLCQTCAATTK